MSYVIYYSDPAKSNYPITVPDNSLYNGVGSGGLTIVGKNYPGYGQSVATDFIHLLENFANSTPPINPIEGQLWYDNLSLKLKFNNGTATNSNWKPINGIYQQDIQPVDATTGDIWVDTVSNLMKIYSNAQQWLPVGISTSSNNSGFVNGAVYQSVTDIKQSKHDSIIFYIGGIEQAVLTSESFTAVGGFYNSNLNLNFSTGLNLPNGSIINGISDSANNLNQGTEKLSSYLFVRNDISQTVNGALSIAVDNNSLQIGKDPTFILERTINGSNANFLNKYPGYGLFTFNITDNHFKNIPVLTIGSNPQQVKILSSQNASSTSTGALVVHGGASIGADLYINGQIFINGGKDPLTATYSLPYASSSLLGGVKLDNSTIKINKSGQIFVDLSTRVNSTTMNGAVINGSTINGFHINATTIKSSQIYVNGSKVVTENSLPIATNTTLGVVKIDGSTITIDDNGVISASNGGANGYILPTASTSQLGGVKIDGSTITINNGVIRSLQYSLPIASSSQLGGVFISGTNGINIVNGNIGLVPASSTQLGGVKVDGSTITINNGVISATGGTGGYTLPPATTLALGGVMILNSTISGIVNTNGSISLATASSTQLGGVKIDGSTITINGNGQLQATGGGGNGYILPIASTSQLGGVKIDGSTITINGNGQLQATGGGGNGYILPIASTSQLGGVKIDGSTITINGNGQLQTSTYTLPFASNTQLGGVVIPNQITSGITNSNGFIGLATASNTQIGGVKIDGLTIQSSNGVISAPLPTASTSQLGGVKIDGSTITINGNGQLQATGGGGNGYVLPIASTTQLGGIKIDGTTLSFNGNGQLQSSTYTLPIASTSQLGGVKVDGSTITINNGTISVSNNDSGSFLLNTNGFQRFPSGLIMQWGTTPDFFEEGRHTIILPMPFPTAILNVSATLLMSIDSMLTPAKVYLYLISNSSIGVYLQTGYDTSGNVTWPVKVTWTAIGY